MKNLVLERLSFSFCSNPWCVSSHSWEPALFLYTVAGTGASLLASVSEENAGSVTSRAPRGEAVFTWLWKLGRDCLRTHESNWQRILVSQSSGRLLATWTCAALGTVLAAAAAKSLQSCLTLCDPTDRSPPGSSVHGIFQARGLEWCAIAFSKGSCPPAIISGAHSWMLSF